MEKEDQQNQSSNDDKFDSYIRRGTNVREMGKGILIGLGYCILSFILVAILKEWRYSIIFAILYIGIIFYFFYRKRKYLAIGLIFLVTVPPAIIGGCIYLTS
jgi:hypothetical protein